MEKSADTVEMVGNPHFVGTWKLSPDASKFHELKPTGPDHTVTISHACAVRVDFQRGAENLQFSYKGLPKAEHSKFAIEKNFDQSDVEFAAKKLDERTYEHTWRSAGVENKAKAVVSHDGKTMTYTFETVNGKPAKDVLVFHKQHVG